MNREKFIDEANREWNEREPDILWEFYIFEAIGWMIDKRAQDGRISPEAVGVAKVLKTAIKLREFQEKQKKDGKTEYKLNDKYEYIKEILEA